MLNAFCRVAPSVRRSFLAILPAAVFLRAIVLSALTSLEVHARRFFDFLAIISPFQERQQHPLAGADSNSTDRFWWAKIMRTAVDPYPLICPMEGWGELRNSIVRSFLATYRPRSKSQLRMGCQSCVDNARRRCEIAAQQFNRIKHEIKVDCGLRARRASKFGHADIILDPLIVGSGSRRLCQ